MSEQTQECRRRDQKVREGTKKQLGKQYKDLEYNSKNDAKPSEDFEEASEVI